MSEMRRQIGREMERSRMSPIYALIACAAIGGGIGHRYGESLGWVAFGASLLLCLVVERMAR